MSYVETPPHPALRSLVACYWAIEGARLARRILPDGCIDVVLLGGVARVVGSMTRAFVAPPGNSAVIGVRFLPGEAVRILPEAPRELTDGSAELVDVWQQDARALEERLALVGTVGDGALLTRAAPVLDRALRDRLAGHAGEVCGRVRVAREVLAAGVSVREAAAHAGLSERQLGRRFRERVGVSPKVFARVKRLERAVAALVRGARCSTAATMAGYADQAHFSRDAAEFAGISPAALGRELKARG